MSVTLPKWLDFMKVSVFALQKEGLEKAGKQFHQGTRTSMILECLYGSVFKSLGPDGPVMGT